MAVFSDAISGNIRAPWKWKLWGPAVVHEGSCHQCGCLGDANKRPSFVFPWGVPWEWVLRASLRTVKRCSVGPWPVVPLLKRTTAWTCLVKESSTVATWAESQCKFYSYGGKDLATLYTRLLSIWLVERLWRPSTVSGFPPLFSAFQCSIRDTLLALPESVCRVLRWNFLCIPNLLTPGGLASLSLAPRVECSSFVWNPVEGAKDAESALAHFCCVVSWKHLKRGHFANNCLRWMESSSECQMSTSASADLHVFRFALGSAFVSQFLRVIVPNEEAYKGIRLGPTLFIAYFLHCRIGIWHACGYDWACTLWWSFFHVWNGSCVINQQV